MPKKKLKTSAIKALLDEPKVKIGSSRRKIKTAAIKTLLFGDSSRKSK